MIAAPPLPALPRRPRAAAAADPAPRTLIDELLAEQATLATPVARFAADHASQAELTAPYRTLIPLTKPGQGEQYAFEVSLDRCTGCKACVSACHSLNGLDEHEAWRDTGVLHGGSDQPGWQQTITTACHHCGDPACLNGCPVGAYEKDDTTGIVRHLDDQCIGCSYCILKCPYDVPKYSKKRGIVRKCDMCHQRLAEGEAPACVQACPTEAIRIITVTAMNPAAEVADSTLFHANVRSETSAVPSSRITRPTTRYIGRPIPASAVAGDRESLIVQHTHWPLVLMLVLTQAGLGFLGAASLSGLPVLLTCGGAVLFFAGMAASIFHLGKPHKAWRFFLGLRTSWLSREILAFSLLAPLPLLLCAFSLWPQLGAGPFEAVKALVILSLIPLGLIAIFTSVMIYHDTCRSGWRFSRGACRFFGTALNFGGLGVLLVSPDPRFALGFAALVCAKMIPEARLLRQPSDPDAEWLPDVHSARLLRGPLCRTLNTRFLLAFAAVGVAFVQPWLALPVLLAAELVERKLFFQSVQAPKMPGNFGPG